MPRHEYLYGQTLPQLEALCNRLEMPRFAAKQIARWLYDKHATTIEAMSDLSARHRALLAETYEVGLTAPEKVSISTDGTKKYLYRTSQNHFIESAYIPDGDRATLCISSQAGCRMGCRFCATGRQGLQHSLSTNEILNQIESLPERERLTNVVFMGMGEPLDNLDSLLPALEVLTSAWGFTWVASRNRSSREATPAVETVIRVGDQPNPHAEVRTSSAGVASRLERFLEATQVHLAVSLHNPFPHERAEIMPIEKAWPIREVVEILRRYDFTHQRRVSFEYIVMSGLNDSPRHIRELCRLLDGIKCRINLIRFHKIPGSPYFSPDDRAMIAFRDALTAKGIHTTIRTSRGEDIQAACGLLSTAQNEAAQF